MSWLEHAADCDVCYRARQDVERLRRREIGRCDVAMPCPAGMRLMPLADVDLCAEPITREYLSGLGPALREIGDRQGQATRAQADRERLAGRRRAG